MSSQHYQVMLTTTLLAVSLASSARAQVPQGGASSVSGLENKLVEAQIENQKAQAVYYRSVAKPTHAITTASVGILGTLLGAFVAFFSLQRQARIQAKSEDTRWEHARQDEETKRRTELESESRREIRLATADLAKKIAVAAHSMCWILWFARFDPPKFTQSLINEHDQRMNALYADIVAAQAVVAALREEIYAKSRPLIAKIYNFDGELSRLAIQVPESIGELGKLWERASQLEAEIPQLFLGVLDVLKASEGGKPPNPASAADA